MQRSAWGPEQRLLTGGLVFLVTAIAFEGLAVPTVLPATLDDLGGLALYGWAFSGFWLASLLGIGLAGVESDRTGPLRPFLLGAATFSVGLAVAALAPSMTVVVAGRVIQGLGAGAISAVTYVAIGRGYDPSAQPRMIAVISSAWVLPGLVGPLVAGVLAEQLSWRWVFGALVPLVPLAAVALVGPMRRLRVEEIAPGAQTASAGTAGLRHSLQLVAAGTVALGVLSARLPLAVAALVALVALLAAIDALRRLLPPGSLTAGTGRGAAVATLGLLSIAFLGAEAFVPLAVSSVRGAGTLAGGLPLTCAAFTWAAGSWLQARLAPVSSRRVMVTAGLVLVLAGIGLVTPVPVASVPVGLAAVAWAIAGLGMGLAYSTTALVVIESAPPGSEGSAASAVQLANTLGIALGTGVAGAIVAYMATSGAGLAPGIAIADLVLLATCGVGILTATRIAEPAARGAPPPARLVTGEHGPGL